MTGNNYTAMDYTLNQEQLHQNKKPRVLGENWGENNEGMMVDYMFNSNSTPPQQLSSGFCSSTSLDRLSFADVMQFADFGPKLALNQQSAAPPPQPKNSYEEGTAGGIMNDPVYFLKFPVLSDRLQHEDDQNNPLLATTPPVVATGHDAVHKEEDRLNNIEDHEKEGEEEEDQNEVRLIFENTTSLLNNNDRPGFLGGNLQHHHHSKNTPPTSEVVTNKNRRKRLRSVKTNEEVESQRMTHIAVERNRRKQMNEHLRVLRSLMPGSYVQRGDQASIIGGAIEFVRELEQLLHCLESQKRRRLFGSTSTDSSSSLGPAAQPPPLFPPNLPTLPNDLISVDLEPSSGLREETAENKSCLADVEVKMLGMDAMIKILSRRRHGQLLKTIAALEDLQLNILHTNITTIEQTVLYSFNVKVTSETIFTADDIASSIQQIFNFIHASSTI